MTTTTRETRQPVSFRMPRNELTALEEYAINNQVSKSDALLHYLRKGIEADSAIGAQLISIQESLEKVLSAVQASSPLPTIKEISEVFCRAAKNYPAIERGYLFGSFAKETATNDSDIDLRLILDEDRGFSLFDLSRLIKDLERTLGKKVDILTARLLEDKRLNESFEREKVLIYERTAAQALVLSCKSQIA